jgi:hypothetical protein
MVHSFVCNNLKIQNLMVMYFLRIYMLAEITYRQIVKEETEHVMFLKLELAHFSACFRLYQTNMLVMKTTFTESFQLKRAQQRVKMCIIFFYFKLIIAKLGYVAFLLMF